jgi:UDP-N-acetylmuramate--alanine ligase
MREGYDQAQLPQLPTPPARVHFVGVGGVGVSGLARMLAARGYEVRGSDLSESLTTAALRAEGIPVMIGHAAENVREASLVVVTAAAPADNPEIVAARTNGTPVAKRAAVLGLLANDSICLAVAGTHGKSTTSGMAAVALTHAGLEPSFAVGATVRELGANARLGTGPHFVVEADEYDFSFLWLRPDVAIVTTLESDHPDVFPDFPAYLAAFVEFTRRIKPHGTLVVNGDDHGCAQLGELVARAGGPHVISYGYQHGDWRLQARGSGAAEVLSPSGKVLPLRLRVPGRHNLMNALAVLAAAEPLGIEPAVLLPGLAAFSGVGRRFEILLESPELTVVDDYAHHPSEIRANLSAARERYPSKRIMAIFQPHTYSRTRAFAGEFAAALDDADAVILAEIYPSRETDTLGISSATIAEQMRVSPRIAAHPAEAARLAVESLLPGDVVLVMGAGDIYTAAAQLADQGGAP